MPKVLGIAPSGKRGPVSEENLPEFIRRGGRVATPEETTAAKLDAEYDAKSTGDKVLQAATWGGIGPTSEAYLAEGRHILTGGLSEAASKTVRDYVDPGSGAAYAKHLDELKTAHPLASAAGDVAGLGVGVAMGGAGPFGALGEAGAPVGKAVGGLATRLGASGRVAATASGVARGAVEGGILAGAEQASGTVTHDTPEDGDKFFSAVGHGALVTGALGGILGLGAHVLGQRAALTSSARAMSALSDAAEEDGRVLSKGGVPEAEAAPQRAPLEPVDGEVTSAGPKGVRPYDARGDRWATSSGRVGLDVDAGLRSAQDSTEPVWFKNRAMVDPNAGELDGIDPHESPFSFLDPQVDSGANRASRRAAVEGGMHNSRVGFGGGGSGELAPVETASGPARAVQAAELRFRGVGNKHLPLDAESPFTLEAPPPRGTPITDALLESPVAHEPATVGDSPPGAVDLPVSEAEGVPLRPWGAKPAAGVDTLPGTVDLPAEETAKPSIFGRAAGVADKAIPKLVGKVAGKGIRSIIGGAVAGAIGHTVGGPIVGSISYGLGHAATDWASGLLMKAGSFKGILGILESKTGRAAEGVLDADALAHVESAPDAANIAAVDISPREEAMSRQSTAQKIMQWFGDIRANPGLIQGKLEEGAHAVSSAAGPKAAAAYTASALRAIDFIGAHIPIKERRDPFDPHRLPTLNSDEADRLIRAARYAAQPWTVYDDFGRGRIYPEGIRAAKTFNPTEFSQFQAELREKVQARVERDPTLTQAQRLRLDKLLGYAAGATMQKSSITRLQQNMLAPLRASPVGAMGEGSAPPSAPTPPPIKLTIDHSGFGDNIEARRASGG